MGKRGKNEIKEFTAMWALKPDADCRRQHWAEIACRQLPELSHSSHRCDAAMHFAPAGHYNKRGTLHGRSTSRHK
jgi:hypothetical protein